MECGGTEHETSGLFGNIADEREAINPLSVWLDTIKPAYHRILWNFRLTPGTAALMLSRVSMTKYANSQDISQPAGDWTRDTVRCRYSAKWHHVYMNIIYPLPSVWCDDTSRWTWSYSWSNISIAEILRIPTLPCPHVSANSGLNYCLVVVW